MQAQRLPLLLLNLLVFGVTLALMLLGIALTPPPLREISPPLLLPLLYFWMNTQPLSFSLFSFFLLGLFSDILMGLPLGAMPLIVLLLYWLARNNARRTKRGFITVWLHFSLHSTIAMFALALLISIYQWRIIAPEPLIIQLILMVFSYPLLHGLLSFLLKKLKLEARHG